MAGVPAVSEQNDAPSCRLSLIGGTEEPTQGTRVGISQNLGGDAAVQARILGLDILSGMPVIVVGADTELGEAIVAALLPRQGEVRAFVSGVEAGLALRGARGESSDR